ncbi:MAG: flagellar FliJ family protein [Planctomycetota bacterium]|jgi:flagellar FliJ protein
MKRFVWRLQRVLDIKTKEEQMKKAELVKLTEELARVRSELLTQKRILDNLIDDIAKESAKTRLGKQEFFLKCSKTTSEVIEKLKEKVSELESAQRQKNAEVLKVKRFREGLEKLQVEAKTQFIKEQERLEQKDADETATISFVRKVIQAKGLN